MEVKASLEWKISITLWLDFLLNSWGNSAGWGILERGAFCTFCFLLVLHQVRDVSCLHYKWGPQRRKAHMERGVFGWLQRIKEGRFLKGICKNLHFFHFFLLLFCCKGLLVLPPDEPSVERTRQFRNRIQRKQVSDESTGLDAKSPCEIKPKKCLC